MREVLDDGPQYKLYAGVEDDDCLQYRCLNAKSASDIGQLSIMTRTSLAAWAKCEVPMEEVQDHLLKLQAKRLSSKLTVSQRIFLLSFDGDLTVNCSIECSRHEFRTAVALREKGIIAEMPDKLKAEEDFYDVKFSQLGLHVLNKVIDNDRKEDIVRQELEHDFHP